MTEEKHFKRAVKDDALTKWIISHIRKGKGKITTTSLIKARIEGEYNIYNRTKNSIRSRLKRLIKEGKVQVLEDDQGKKLVIV